MAIDSNILQTWETNTNETRVFLRNKCLFTVFKWKLALIQFEGNVYTVYYIEWTHFLIKNNP